MNNRSPQQITAQLAALEKDKKRLPEFSLFGDPTHRKIDIKIMVLRGQISTNDLPDGDWDEEDAENQIYKAAQEAEEWLSGEINDDLAYTTTVEWIE